MQIKPNNAVGTRPIKNPLVKRRHGLPAASGNYIVGSGIGLYKYNNKKLLWGPVSIGGGSLRAQYDPNGYLYTTEGNNINKYDIDGNLISSAATQISGSILRFQMLRGYCCCIIETSDGTYIWPGITLLLPDGSTSWYDYEGNAANNIQYNYTNIGIDKNLNIWTVAVKKGNICVLQRRGPESTLKTEIIIDSPALTIIDVMVGFDYLSKYVYIIEMLSGGGFSVFKYNIDTGNLRSLTNGTNYSSMASQWGISGLDRFYFALENDLFYVDKKFEAIHNVNTQPHRIDALTCDTGGNIYVGFTYQDAGTNRHYVVRKYDSSHQRIFSLDKQVNGAYMNTLSSAPTMPAFLLEDNPPQSPSEVTALVLGSKVFVNWQYNNVIPVHFNIYADGVEVASNLSADARSYSYSYSGLGPKRITIQAESYLNKSSYLITATTHVDIDEEAYTISSDYVNRVGNNFIRDGQYLYDFIKKCLNLGIWNNLAFAIDANWGLIKDSSNGISKFFDLSNAQNDASAGANLPTYSISSLGKASSSWVYTNNNIITPVNPIELIDSTGFYIVRHGQTHVEMIGENSSNSAQIREDGNSFSLNGSQPLGAPSVSGNTQAWHIAQSLIKKASTAQVGINGTFGAVTSHAATTWPIDRFGYYSSGSIYNWNGDISGIYLFNQKLDPAIVSEFLDFINSYYGIF